MSPFMFAFQTTFGFILGIGLAALTLGVTYTIIAFLFSWDE